MTEQELRPCPFCGCDTLEIFTDYYSRRTVNCPYCGLWRLLDTWNNRPIEDKLNNTIDVLTKKYANVQFVNKKLQEKIKRQSERITQLEALYREEIKTKKQNALREHAEKAEAMVERMIEAGNRLYELAEELDDLVDEFRAYPDLVSWRTLVAEWKERE